MRQVATILGANIDTPGTVPTEILVSAHGSHLLKQASEGSYGPSAKVAPLQLHRFLTIDDQARH